jgi:hypothetical protein
VSHPPVGRLAPSVPAGKALVGSPGAAADRQWQTTENAPNEPGAKESTTMAVVTMRQLLESGVHFGHQTRRWNPKMKRFIFTERNGIYIIDLQQSLSYIDRAYEFVKETVAHGGTSCSSAPRSRPRRPSPSRPRGSACPTSTSAGSAAC